MKQNRSTSLAPDRTSEPLVAWDREPRLRLIMDSLPALISYVDSQQRYQFNNARYAEWFGGSIETHRGQHLRDVLGEEAYRRIQEHVEAALSGERRTFEDRILYRGAGLRNVRAEYVPDVNERSEVEGFFALISDVTESRQEHEFRQRLVDTVQAVILVLDTQGRIVHYNRYMEELVGRPLKDHRGKSWIDTFLPERDRPRIRALFDRAVSGARTAGNINAIVTGNGEERLIEWFDAPLTDASGAVTALLCSGHDITERRELQEQLLNIAEQEQARIGRDLHDDVGQELTALGLVAQTLADSLQERQAPEAVWAARMAESVRRTMRKVQALSRGLIPVEVDAEGLMSALADLAKRINESGVLACVFECRQPAPVEDRRIATQLYRIAQEAVGNAVRHAKARHLWITLETEASRLILTVRDDGVGLKEQQGTVGMGMQIMRYRAELIGGALEIASRNYGGVEVKCSIELEAPNGRD